MHGLKNNFIEEILHVLGYIVSEWAAHLKSLYQSGLDFDPYN